MKKTVISHVQGPPLYCTWNVFYCRIGTQFYRTVVRDQANFLSDQPLVALLSAVIESLCPMAMHYTHYGYQWTGHHMTIYNISLFLENDMVLLVEIHTYGGHFIMVVLTIIKKKTDYSNCPFRNQTSTGLQPAIQLHLSIFLFLYHWTQPT